MPKNKGKSAGLLPQRGSASKGSKAANAQEELTRSGLTDRMDLMQRKALAMELFGGELPPDESSSVGPVSDINRFPAMRLLLTKADEDHATRETKRMIDQILEREQQNRFSYLAHAEWKGRRCGGYEHLQGRSNNLTYHFMFALEEEQLTEHAEGFLACYRTSEQRLDDIIALIPIPYSSVQSCAVLVRLVYMIDYVRRVVQTEASISLLEKTEYNEVIDELFDETTGRIQRQEKKPVDVALDLSVGMHELVERVRAKFPALVEPGAMLARDVPLMVHLRLLAQVAAKRRPGLPLALPPRSEVVARIAAERALKREQAAGGVEAGGSSAKTDEA